MNDQIFNDTLEVYSNQNEKENLQKRLRLLIKYIIVCS